MQTQLPPWFWFWQTGSGNADWETIELIVLVSLQLSLNYREQLWPWKHFLHELFDGEKEMPLTAIKKKRRDFLLHLSCSRRKRKKWIENDTSPKNRPNWFAIIQKVLWKFPLANGIGACVFLPKKTTSSIPFFASVFVSSLDWETIMQFYLVIIS